MNIGDTVTKSDYTKYAIWCNSNNAHIEVVDGAYVVVENETVEVEEDTTETLEDRLTALEEYNDIFNDFWLEYLDGSLAADSDDSSDS